MIIDLKVMMSPVKMFFSTLFTPLLVEIRKFLLKFNSKKFCFNKFTLQIGRN